MPERNRMQARAKALMPSVLLTLLSILQALALELLWAHVIEHDHLKQASWVTVIEWVQIGTTLLGVLLIWMLYSSMVMRFRWVPSTSDTLLPFAIGILEFTLIGQLGADRLGWWFAILGVLYGVTTLALQIIMRRARLDGDNDEFFGGVPRATIRDFYASFALVSLLLVTGAWLGATGHQGPFALLALLGAAAAILYQMYLNNHYWRRSLGLMR